MLILPGQPGSFGLGDAWGNVLIPGSARSLSAVRLSVRKWRAWSEKQKWFLDTLEKRKLQPVTVSGLPSQPVRSHDQHLTP